MKNIICFSKLILGLGLFLFLISSCKRDVNQGAEKLVSENSNGNEIEEDEENIDSTSEYFGFVTESNLFEIEMGLLAVQKGIDKNVKNYGQKLVDDYTLSLENLKTIANRKEIKLSASISEVKGEEITDLNEYTGDEFDKKFLEIMIEGHEKAVAKMTKFSKKAIDDDFKLYASRQIDTYKTSRDAAIKVKEQMSK